MYDKTVRRRRVILGLLVACSLILLTAYFGESAGGGLHSVQRGVLEVVSPDPGGRRAARSSRCATSSAGSATRSTPRASVEDLRTAERGAAPASDRRHRRVRDERPAARRWLDLTTRLELSDNAPVHARVIGASPTLWYSTVTIDKGTGVGRPRRPAGHRPATGWSARSRLSRGDSARRHADHRQRHRRLGATSARRASSGVERRRRRPPDDLRAELRWPARRRREGRRHGRHAGTTSTVGTATSRPTRRDIPIGAVTRVDDPGTDDQEAHVAPFADLRRLDARRRC